MRAWIIFAVVFAGAGSLGFGVAKFVRDLRPLPDSLLGSVKFVQKAQVLDRGANPLSYTYQNAFNLHHLVALHEVPDLLQTAFVEAEDRRFFSHSGVDWLARLNATLQNFKAGRVVRGASTITEQVVRMLHPRPRSFWSRLLEGVEAERLERKVGKAEILEFYLNQVPYARKRRGVLQASYLYFDRDLNTLSLKEMLALAVLVRAPGRLDPLRKPALLQKPIVELAGHLQSVGKISKRQLREVTSTKLDLRELKEAVDATHFVQFVLRDHRGRFSSTKIRTSLNGQLQQTVREFLDNRLRALKERAVSDGAALIVENETGNILAWVNGSSSLGKVGEHYDAVTLGRQPGSTLKPFLYALALERGWSAATLVEDAPLEQAVGMGLHGYRNYSGKFYGHVRLREALGNSLNSPAVRTVNFVGRSKFLDRLRMLGVSSMEKHADHYGDGIALGNAEVNLFELVQAYRTLARGGVFSQLSYNLDAMRTHTQKRVFSEEVSSLIGDILLRSPSKTQGVWSRWHTQLSNSDCGKNWNIKRLSRCLGIRIFKKVYRWHMDG